MPTQVYLDKTGILYCSKHGEPLCWYIDKKTGYKLVQCISCLEESEQKIKKNKLLKE